MDAVPVPMFERHNLCLTCGHDLYGQPRNGTCPNCGASTRESARRALFFNNVENNSRARSGTLLLLSGAVLSGLRLVVVLLFLVSEGNLFFAAVMTLVFLAKAVTEILGEKRFDDMLKSVDDEHKANVRSARLDIRSRRIADVVAGFGLLLLNVVAYFICAIEAQMFVRKQAEPIAVIVLVLAFILLATAAWRAASAYRLRAAVFDECLGASDRGFVGVGRAKATYDTVWLLCCALGPLMMLLGARDVALFFWAAIFLGLIGYGVFWVVMIVLHAILFVQVLKATVGPFTRGFDVVANANITPASE